MTFTTILFLIYGIKMKSINYLLDLMHFYNEKINILFNINADWYK